MSSKQRTLSGLEDDFSLLGALKAGEIQTTGDIACTNLSATTEIPLPLRTSHAHNGYGWAGVLGAWSPLGKMADLQGSLQSLVPYLTVV